MSDKLHDTRTFHVFMPARFDDLPLTLEAFRVYCHLVRRADKRGKSFPSLAKIGEHCFRGSYPNSSEASLKAKAIAAIKELCAYGLIRKELHSEGEGYRHNNYFLTDSDEWKQAEEVHPESCNVRKGRPGLSRARRMVNQDNSINQDNSVIPVNPDRLSPLTQAVNPTLPKGISNEGISNEGIREIEASTSISIAPSAFTKNQTSPRRKQENAATVYASLVDLEGFEKFWTWYRTKICTISEANEGSKAKAAVQWRKLEESNFLGIGRDGFRLACRIYKQKAIATKGIGVQHGENFLSGGKLGEPQWLVLYQERTQANESDFLEGVCDEDDLATVRGLISTELSRLHWSGILPDEWCKVSGCQARLAGDLDLTQSKQYLKWLRGQNAVVAS